MLWLGIALVAVSLGIANVRGTAHIRRSGLYERGQLLAQTVLIWAVPGSVFAVLAVMKGVGPEESADPTARNPESPNSAAITAGNTNWHAP
jgi:hypothetical protein